MDNRAADNGNTARDTLARGLPNARDRFFDSQHYPPQNPYESPLPANYFPQYQPGYELDHDYGTGSTGRYGQATYHQHVYSTLDGGHSGAGGTSGGGGGHKSKNHALAMSGLTLLAFLFFINMLQSCLKEQIVSMNPTVMVMTAGSGRFRKTQAPAITINANKDLNRNDHMENEAIISSVSDNIDLLTNDQGDVFFRPAPKLSFKLDNPFEARSAHLTLQEEKIEN